MKPVTLIRFDEDEARYATCPALMTGLRICEAGHLLEWPRFAELRQPVWGSYRTHSLFVGKAGESFHPV